jgi:hypothetical protein
VSFISPFVFNHIGRLLPYHHYHSVGMSGHNIGHYRPIDHPQPLNPVHFELGIDDSIGIGVGSHLACTNLMPQSRGDLSNSTSPIRVAAKWDMPATRNRNSVQGGVVFLKMARLGDGDCLQIRKMSGQVVNSKFKRFQQCAAPSGLQLLNVYLTIRSNSGGK